MHMHSHYISCIHKSNNGMHLKPGPLLQYSRHVHLTCTTSVMVDSKQLNANCYQQWLWILLIQSYQFRFTDEIICHVNLFSYWLLYLVYLKFLTETSSFLVSTFSTVIVMHDMETKPASTHVMDNDQRNCSQDNPMKPLQICRIIVSI
jgi:hypothetical protein